MVVVSYSGKEINAKLVYYGAGLSGKTTNLESIYEAVPDTSRGKMVSMKTQSDRTLFFDLLPLDLGEIMGFKTRFLLYTVPGQVFYNATRKLVLKGADAIVFVADSEVGKMDENQESLANLHANLAEYGLRLEDIPWVIQYNKRDLPHVYTVEELNAALNPGGAVPHFEAVATQGTGVFETFRGISHLLMEKVTRELRRAPMSSAHARPARTADAAEPAVMPTPSLLDPPTAAPAADAPSAPTAAGAPAAFEASPPASEAASGPVAQAPYHFGRELTLPEGSAPGEPAAAAGSGEAATAHGGSSAAGIGETQAAEPSEAHAPFQAQAHGVATAAEPSSSPEQPGVLDLGVSHAVGEVQAAGSRESHELVVPVSLPRGSRREIVLRIVLQDGE